MFCFHYAGGRAEIFNTWPDGLPEEVEVCAVQLPGRSFRIHEPPVFTIERLILELETAIRPLLNAPFAFFGHSMGALLAFELARSLGKDASGIKPVVLFASGRRAPQIPSYFPPISELPDIELLEVLRSLNGTPAEALGDEEIMKHFLPAIRADFALEERWKYVAGRPLAVPIQALYGTRDHGAGSRLMEGWREQTCEEFRKFRFEGEHFFIHQFQDRILELIAGALADPRIKPRMEARCA